MLEDEQHSSEALLQKGPLDPGSVRPKSNHNVEAVTCPAALGTFGHPFLQPRVDDD